MKYDLFWQTRYLVLSFVLEIWYRWRTYRFYRDSSIYLILLFSPSSPIMELNQNRPHARKSEVSAIWKCMIEIWGIPSL